MGRSSLSGTDRQEAWIGTWFVILAGDLELVAIV